MKIIRFSLVLILIGVFSTVTMADSLPDLPVFGVSLKGVTSSTGTGLFSLFDPNFSFTVLGSDFTTAGQSEEFDFVNASSQLPVRMILDFTPLPGTPYPIPTCDPVNPYFTECGLGASFFWPIPGHGFGGIHPATDLSCDGIHNCFTETPGAAFGVVITDSNGDLMKLAPGEGFEVRGRFFVPEPSTILFALVAGVLLVCCRRQ